MTMLETTTRFAVPLLVAGQGQKDVTHNEAVLALEALAHPVVEDAGRTTPPASAAVGEAYVVGAGASGAWAGRSGTIAYLTPGGWRFLVPVDGLSVWNRAAGARQRFMAGSWRLDLPRDLPPLTIEPPTGGSVVDAQARAAIAALIARLAAAGLLG